jgi:DNA polymerase-1
MPVPRDYVHATTADAVAGWLGRVAGARVVAVDTETTGRDPFADRLLLVQVAAGGEHPVLVLDSARVDPRALLPVLHDTDVLKVFHHGAFDLGFLAQAGVGVRRVADTMLAQQLLDGGEATAGGWGLADLASFRLGLELDKSIRESFEHETPAFTEAQLRYAADDAYATWAVFDQQWRELVARGLVDVARLEFQALPVLTALAHRGIALDSERWLEVVGEAERDLPALADRVQELLVTDTSPRDLFGPTPVNLDSYDQVRAALERVGVVVDSTAEYALRDFADHPAVAALLEYRQVAKVTGNWGGDWALRVRHAATGRVHADWRQIVGTGRIACSDPNLLQIPKEARFRACFGGEPGRALVVADYSQQELRILAAVSGDEALTEVFRSGGDLHRTTAAMVFDVTEDAVAPAQRAAAKQLNFGLMYGMGAPGFARATGTSVGHAREVMERYFETFPRVASWLRGVEAESRRHGRVRTPLGRLRVTGDGSSTTLARNAPIQGAGADMIKLALVEVDRRLAAGAGSGAEPGHGPARRWPGPDGLVLVVHDELVVEVDEGVAGEVAAIVEDGMLAAARRVLGDVPAVVDARVRSRWGSLPETVAAGGVAT